MSVLDKILPAKIKVDPTKIYIALTGVWTPAGNIKPDERARGTDARVKAYPKFWVEADTTPEEQYGIWVERFGASTMRSPRS